MSFARTGSDKRVSVDASLGWLERELDLVGRRSVRDHRRVRRRAEEHLVTGADLAPYRVAVRLDDRFLVVRDLEQERDLLASALNVCSAIRTESTSCFETSSSGTVTAASGGIAIRTR